MAWSDTETDEVAKAFAIACELTGAEFSEGASDFVLAQLQQRYSAQMAIAGLERVSMTSKGRVTLGLIIEAIEWKDRKQISDGAARNQIYLTTLRGCALVERILWDRNSIAIIESKLRDKGYKPEKMPGYAAAQPTQPRALPHWTEPKEDEP